MVLPPVRGRLQDSGLRRWLSRSALESVDRRQGVLAAVLEALGKPLPGEGSAAMRMWGQTGDQPTAWIAAADPVYLEPRLDHLCLHALQQGDTLTKRELRVLFDHLQKTLASNTGYGFARLGECGYLRAEQPIATARESAIEVDGRVPNDYMPTGDAAATYLQLVSEIEMALHDHPVNMERSLRGAPPVNSLWIWGGGCAPAVRPTPHPPLFADDPMLRGYWESVSGEIDTWPGTIEACLETASAGFVAVAPIDPDDTEQFESCLHELRHAMISGRLRQLTLVFADGVRARVRPFDRFCFWRRPSGLLENVRT